MFFFRLEDIFFNICLKILFEIKLIGNVGGILNVKMWAKIEGKNLFEV